MCKSRLGTCGTPFRSGVVENDKTSANVQDSDASATVDKTPLCTVYGDMWILYDSGTVQYSSTVYGYG